MGIKLNLMEMNTVAYALHRLVLIEQENLTKSIKDNDPVEVVQMMLDRVKKAETLRDKMDDSLYEQGKKEL